MHGRGGNLIVLQVLPALETGGVERGTLEMTAAITEAGGRALVASSGGRMAADVQAAGGTHITLPLATKNPIAMANNIARLAAVIRREHVRIVHARSRAPAWSAYFAARQTGAHFITTYHGVYSENLPGKRLYNSVMAKGERVIAISNHVARQIVARHATDPARIRVIPRGVDLTRFDPQAVAPERTARLAQAWRLPRGAPVIMLPARLTRWKGHGVLLDALARMERKDAVAVLLGAGRAGYAAELQARAERLGVAARVRIVGRCDDMPAALLLADAAVNASTEPEPFGRTVIEAQAMGRLVIVADHGGPAETVEHGATGWRVPPDDAAALARALDLALNLAPAERAAVAARARASVAAAYTSERMQAATLAVYREALGSDLK